MKTLTIIFLLFLPPSLFAQVDWGYSIGGTEWERPFDICTDKNDNVYIIGRYSGKIDFDHGPDIFIDSTVNYDVFIQKTSPEGSHIWTKFIKGTSLTQSASIVCDDNYLYITGEFSKTADFDPGPGTSIINSSNYGDIVIVKLNLDGSFVWVKQVEGNGYDGNGARGIALDSNSNIFITGYYSCPVDFDMGAGTHMAYMYPGYEFMTTDGYISKYDSDGSLQWVKTFNGKKNESGTSIVTDPQGYSYITGRYLDTIYFEISSGTYTLPGSIFNAKQFIGKYDPDGELLWVKSMTESNSPNYDDLALTKNDELYFVGHGTYNLNTGLNIFKLNSSGDVLWNNNIKSAVGNSIALDKDQNIWLTGFFGNQTDFDPGPDTAMMYADNSFSSYDDIFIEKLDSNGNFLWCTSFGDWEIDFNPHIAISKHNHIYITGEYRSTPAFSPDFWTDSLTSEGSADIMILKLISEHILNLEEPVNDNFRLYPNPTFEVITIHSNSEEPISVEITDVNGKIVYRKQNTISSENIDMRRFLPGVYFVQLESEKAEKRYKVIKQ